MKVHFTNQWYPYLTSVCLFFALLIRVSGMLIGVDIFSVIHTVLILIVMFSLVRYAKYARIVVKAWSGIAILGGVLGLTSMVVLIMIDRTDSIETYKLVSHIVHLVFGLVIFMYWDSSVSSKEA